MLWLKSVAALEGIVSFIEGWRALDSSLLVDTLLSRGPVSLTDNPRLSSVVCTVASTVLDHGDDVAVATALEILNKTNLTRTHNVAHHCDPR